MHVFVEPFFLVLSTVATALLFCFVLHTLHKLYQWVATTCINTDVSPCLEDQRDGHVMLLQGRDSWMWL